MNNMIDRRSLVQRHNPVLHGKETESPLSVGNGELAFTADITGMQTLYDEYRVCPLCTMTQWGWHSSPAERQDGETGRYYTMADLKMTEYEHQGRRVNYPVQPTAENEEIYNWLRKNPHRLNLARIRLMLYEQVITGDMIEAAEQELDLYTGKLTSRFCLLGEKVLVQTVCGDPDVLGFSVDSGLLAAGLTIRIDFPYGSFEISASDWNHPEWHMTVRTDRVTEVNGTKSCYYRTMDQDKYSIRLHIHNAVDEMISSHTIRIFPLEKQIEFTIDFTQEEPEVVAERPFSSFAMAVEESRQRFASFWETGGMIDFSGSECSEADELERRMICSLYLTAIQCTGTVPPQETGLTCNSWYGKFHLEMHPFHSAYLALWGRSYLLEKSFSWYLKSLPQAKENAARNGYRGARWPKMIGPEAVDSPSRIAPLLIWQQPHILYMLELCYRSRKVGKKEFLEQYFELVTETAEFMMDFTTMNPVSGRRELTAPLIPAQECHEPETTKNPAFELAYWSFGLKLASEWYERLIKICPSHYKGWKEKAEEWNNAAETMAALSVKNGLILAHENCPDTYNKYNKDHPSMLFICGFLPGEGIDRELVKNSADEVNRVWDFESMWGWDFALMAMTETRLQRAQNAVNVLLKDTAKNSYVVSGNNAQRSRSDLPLYLPGNGALLLALAVMTAGYEDSLCDCPGFPKESGWKVTYEKIQKYF